MNRLYRSRDRVVAGVAGGMADYLRIDPTIVRVLWAVLIVMSGGTLLLVYMLMAFVVPEEPSPSSLAFAGPNPGGPPDPSGPIAQPGGSAPGATSDPPTYEQWRAGRDERRFGRPERSGGSSGTVIFGLILVAVGAWFLAREYLPQIDFDRLWPILLIAVGILLVLSALRRRDRT